MNDGVIPISAIGIALSLLPLALLGWIYHRSNRGGGLILYATVRMLAQLFLMGFALVSLPGMMTGQIIAGVDPLLAIRYQIVVMAMIFGSAGLSVALFLRWEGKDPTHSPLQ